MIKINDCDIIKDLLPSYADRLTNETTNAIIEEHLKDCPDAVRNLKGSDKPGLHHCRTSRIVQR